MRRSIRGMFARNCRVHNFKLLASRNMHAFSLLHFRNLRT